ncbi:MAG: hypothetical protein ACRDPK_13485 [Carbonactinosporaceae bacterium]
MERDWFRTRFAGLDVGYPYCTDDDLDPEFDIDVADAAYARHNGHADLLRERIDGRTGH